MCQGKIRTWVFVKWVKNKRSRERERHTYEYIIRRVMYHPSRAATTGVQPEVVGKADRLTPRLRA